MHALLQICLNVGCVAPCMTLNGNYTLLPAYMLPLSMC
jgi:hypothetical protein